MDKLSSDNDRSDQNLNHSCSPANNSYPTSLRSPDFISRLQKPVNSQPRVTSDSNETQPHEERYADKVVRLYHLHQAWLKRKSEERAGVTARPSAFGVTQGAPTLIPPGLSGSNFLPQAAHENPSPYWQLTIGWPPFSPTSRLNPAALEWKPPGPDSVFPPPPRFDPRDQHAAPSSSRGTLLVYTELGYVQAEQAHTPHEVLPRLKRLPGTSFRDDGSVDIDLTWAIHSLGYGHFEGAHGERSRLKNNSWMRTHGTEHNLPENFIRWLSGDILGGVLHLPADEARKFWTSPHTE